MNEAEKEIRAEISEEEKRQIISAINGRPLGVGTEVMGDPAPPARARPAWRLRKAQRARAIADIAYENAAIKAEEAIAAAEALAALTPEPEIKAKPRTRGKAKAK